MGDYAGRTSMSGGDVRWMGRWLFIALEGVTLASCGFLQPADTTPPSSVVFRVSPDHETFTATLAAAGEAPRWRVMCGADGQGVDVWGEERFSGLVQCALYDLQDGTNEDLFATLSQDRSWQSRGRFVVDHLAPGCAQTPDWGAYRTFRLRGHVVSL